MCVKLLFERERDKFHFPNEFGVSESVETDLIDLTNPSFAKLEVIALRAFLARISDRSCVHVQRLPAGLVDTQFLD